MRGVCWDSTLTRYMTKVEIIKAWAILTSWSSFQGCVRSSSNSRRIIILSQFQLPSNSKTTRFCHSQLLNQIRRVSIPKIVVLYVCLYPCQMRSASCCCEMQLWRLLVRPIAQNVELIFSFSSNFTRHLWYSGSIMFLMCCQALCTFWRLLTYAFVTKPSAH